MSSFAHPLTSARVRELSKPNALIPVVGTFATWAVILGIIWVSETVRHPLVYPLAIMLIAGQQHGLLIQMHDVAHRRFSRNRIFSDVFVELFCAWPMFFRMAAYRENHREHHKHVNTELDPDFRPSRFPKNRRAIVRMLIKDLLAINTLEQLGELKRLAKPTPLSTKVLRVAFYLALAAALTHFGGWKIYLVYWVLPLFTWLKVALRLRAISDHAGIETRARPFDTRTVIPNLFDRLFIAPRNSSYHFGHHLYEGVPWYRLKTLHDELMQNEEVQKQCRITHGYWRLFLEFPKDADERAAEPVPVNA